MKPKLCGAGKTKKLIENSENFAVIVAHKKCWTS